MENSKGWRIWLSQNYQEGNSRKNFNPNICVLRGVEFNESHSAGLRITRPPYNAIKNISDLIKKPLLKSVRSAIWRKNCCGDREMSSGRTKERDGGPRWIKPGRQRKILEYLESGRRILRFIMNTAPDALGLVLPSLLQWPFSYFIFTDPSSLTVHYLHSSIFTYHALFIIYSNFL